MLDVVVYVCNPSTWQAEAGGDPISKQQQQKTKTKYM